MVLMRNEAQIILGGERLSRREAFLFLGELADAPQAKKYFLS
jgi:hypothetical protein